jgi:hypothetical protein
LFEELTQNKNLREAQELKKERSSLHQRIGRRKEEK